MDAGMKISALVTYPWVGAVVARVGVGAGGWVRVVLVCGRCGWSGVWQAILTASRWF